MKTALLALFLAGPAFAEPSEFLKGAELQAEVTKLCEYGCIVFSPAEAEALKQAIAAKMALDMVRAFEAGKRASDVVCRNKTGGSQ